MELTGNLIDQGFMLADVDDKDFESYLAVKKICYENYVTQYYGGWDEQVQQRMNRKAFDDTKKQTCFFKILLQGESVGFFYFNEGD